MTNRLTDIFKTNLAVKTTERVAVIADDADFDNPSELFPDRLALAEALAEAARGLGAEATTLNYPNRGRSGVEPPEEVFAAVYPEGFSAYASREGLLEPLLDKSIQPEGERRLATYLQAHAPQFDVLLIVARYSVSHTRFRNLLTAHTAVRVATMPGVEPYMFSGVMTADWPAVAARSRAAAKHLSAASRAVIESPGGRRLTLDLQGRSGLADTGIIDSPGGFGNLPGGEGFIAPVEGSADGELSVGPPDDPSRWALCFASGRLTDVLGDPPFAARIEQAASEYPDVKNVAELGIGTNENASEPNNILEAEKILGTVHLALGDNAGFGGKVSVPFHQDFVVYRPTLRLEQADGSTTTVLEQGKFLLDA